MRALLDDEVPLHQNLRVKSTRYFEEQVLRKRPYLDRAWCEDAVKNPDQVVRQFDGRVRYWKYIPALGKFLRVVTLEDGETIHNAFPDRNFGGGR